MPKEAVPRSGPHINKEAPGAGDPDPAVSEQRPHISVPDTQPLDQDGDTEALPYLNTVELPAADWSRLSKETALAHRARRRLLLKLGVALMSLLLIGQAIYLSPFTDPAAGDPARVPSPVPLAEVQPFGVNTFLHKEVDPWKKDKTLQMARDIGAGWIKQQFPWAEIELRDDPNNPYWDAKNSQNAWSKFDGIVEEANRYGLRVIARIDNAPLWAHPANQDAKAPPDAQHMQDFANFINIFVQRYKGRVAAIQIWNEPNLASEWGNQPVNASAYVELLKVAYEAAKKADPNVIVLAAPLATTNDKTTGNLDELDYLQQMYDAGAKQYFDAMDANAYGTNYPPEDPPSPSRLNFRRVELLHAVMVKNGDGNKAVWFNEYGWNASPPDITPLPWGRVSDQQQADYTVRGIQYARRNWPWAGVFTVWYLRQVGDISRTQSDYYFGLVTPDFVVTPAYNELAAAAQSYEKTATPGRWGPLSPPIQADPSWYIGLDPAVPGGAYVYPSVAGDSLNVPFLGTDLKLTLAPFVNNPANSSVRYYVTVDGQSKDISPSIPRDANGDAYLAPSLGSKATEVTIAQGLGAEFRTRQHVLQIQAVDTSAPGNKQAGGADFAPPAQALPLPGIAGVQVAAQRSYWLFALLTAALLAGIAFISWALRRTA